MRNEIKETIKKTVVEVLRAMDEQAENIEIDESQDRGILVNLTLKDPQFLIGPKGIYLEALEKIVRALAKRKISDPEPFFVNLDINNYRGKRTVFLRQMAREIGDQVSLSKKKVTLEPMSAFERRIIHLELASRQDVATQSVGEEPERKVEIRPYP